MPHSPKSSAAATALAGLPVVVRLAEAAGSTPCHLVGGALRDAALGLEVHDFDAVVDGRGEEIARRLAQSLPARFVPLGGKAFPAFRLVADDFELDLWDRSGMTLDEDLARRDLTINAMALDLATRETVDPFGGFIDLDRRLLRAVTPGSFSGDPLRLLRLARLAVQLPGFQPVHETLLLARASAHALPTVAGERIRDELARIVGSPRAAVGVKILGEIGVYPGLWTYRLGEIAPTAQAIARLEAFEPLTREAWGRGTEEGAWAAGRWALLFAELRNQGGKAEIALARFADRGYLSKADAQTVGYLLALSSPPPSEPERRLFLHRLGPALWPAALAYLGALGAASLDELRALARLAADDGAAIFDPPKLLSSEAVRAAAGVAAGPALGRLLAELKKAQVRGEVATPAEAERWVRAAALPQ